MAKANHRKGKAKPPAARPLLVLTRNGRPVARLRGPQGANDLRLIWGLPVLGGGGWWTKNRKPMKNGAFLFPPGVNDWHFFADGVSRPGVPIAPPPWATDIDLFWRRSVIVEAWWTLNGQRIEPISLAPRSAALHIAQGGSGSSQKAAHPQGWEPLVPMLIELLKSQAVSTSQLIGFLEDLPEWIFVDAGDDLEGGRSSSANPEQCVCGTDWMVRTAKAIFNALPAANDISALYSTIDYPKLGACDPPCVPRQIFKGKMWQIYKSRTSGQFMLFCSKRVQWHCETMENPS